MLRQSSDLSLTRLTGYNPRKTNRTELTNMPGSAHNELWPELPYEAWKDTRETLHLWTQIAGKIRLALTPWLNHSWHVPLYVTARGLSTSPIPYAEGIFEIEFDFNEHLVKIITGDGREMRSLKAEKRHRADFEECLLLEVELPFVPDACLSLENS
jgi:hypothetical protein